MPDILAASEDSFGKRRYPPAGITHFVGWLPPVGKSSDPGGSFYDVGRSVCQAPCGLWRTKSNRSGTGGVNYSPYVMCIPVLYIRVYIYPFGGAVRERLE